MKILKYRIDKVTSHYPNGGEITLYYVKYLKYGWFFQSLEVSDAGNSGRF